MLVTVGFSSPSTLAAQITVLYPHTTARIKPVTGKASKTAYLTAGGTRRQIVGALGQYLTVPNVDVLILIHPASVKQYMDTTWRLKGAVVVGQCKNPCLVEIGLSVPPPL
jgi:hypothetical protein